MRMRSAYVHVFFVRFCRRSFCMYAASEPHDQGSAHSLNFVQRIYMMHLAPNTRWCGQKVVRCLYHDVTKLAFQPRAPFYYPTAAWNSDYGHVVATNLIGPFHPRVRSCKQDTLTKLEGPHEIVPKPSENSASRNQ